MGVCLSWSLTPQAGSGVLLEVSHWCSFAKHLLQRSFYLFVILVVPVYATLACEPCEDGPGSAHRCILSARHMAGAL